MVTSDDSLVPMRMSVAEARNVGVVRRTNDGDLFLCTNRIYSETLEVSKGKTA